MLTYNSSSFFGARHRRPGRAGGAHHAAGHNPVAPHAPAAHVHAPVAAPAPGLPVKTLPISDDTIGTDAVMIEDLSIREHLAGGDDHISLVYKTGRNFRACNARRADFTRLGNNLYVYECKAHAGQGYGVNIHDTHPAKLADMSKVGLSIGGGFIDMSRGKFTAGHKVYFLEPTRKIQRVADHRFLYGDGAGIVHCQENSGGQVYDLYPARFTEDVVDLTDFGRRRPRRVRRS